MVATIPKMGVTRDTAREVASFALHSLTLVRLLVRIPQGRSAAAGYKVSR
jgi:hypothetical protein